MDATINPTKAIETRALEKGKPASNRQKRK